MKGFLWDLAIVLGLTAIFAAVASAQCYSGQCSPYGATVPFQGYQLQAVPVPLQGTLVPKTYRTPLRNALFGRSQWVISPAPKQPSSAAAPHEVSFDYAPAFRLQPNICRISVPEGNGVSSTGSGIYVGQGRILSCWHVWRDRTTNSGVAVFPSGERIPITLEAADAQQDSSLARTASEPAGVVPVEFTSERPSPGRTYTLAGYSTGRLGYRAGPFAGS